MSSRNVNCLRTTARGYGHVHQQRRKQLALLVATGRINCRRCGGPIEPGEPFDLGHDDHNRRLPTYPEHRACNRATAAHRSRRIHSATFSPRSEEVLASLLVTDDAPPIVLREVEDRDLDVLFEHWTDREAIRMAAFTPKDPDDRNAFDARWARLRRDQTTTNKVVETEGRVVGHIASFDLDGRREVTYWIGRQDWGKGIATRALHEFLARIEIARPLYGRAASDNVASIRVLEKCGFTLVGEGRGFAHGRDEETDEVVLRLDAPSGNT